MSNRGAEGSAAKTSSGAGERRTNPPQRVHFEALVAMADEGGGSGFEAESVDVSTSGMRLRTAYLPPIGEKLVCRFDGAGSEISATGEVIWRNELARGGEFGLRFTDLDREAESALRSMCAAMNSAGSDAADSSEKGDKDPTNTNTNTKGSSKGTRVRLHIEGLGSPMKARVREADTGEVLVGSNLEFLRVGRSLELEDVDQGVRREAHIDHVKVDIDPETHIPQLVVSLRYSEKAREAAGKAAAAAAAIGAAGAATAGEIAGRAESAGGEKRLSRPGDEGDSSDRAGRRSEPRMRPSRPSQAPSKAIPEEEAQGASAEVDAGDEEDSDEGRAEKLRGLGTKAAAMGKNMAGKVGPSLAAASAKTKSAVLGFVAALQKKRAERSEAQQASAPRRMTAPPPTGALRPQGRKLVRDENGSEEDEETPLPPRDNKRAAIVGSALGLFAVLAVFGMARFFGPGAATQAGASADSQGQNAPAALAAGTSTPAAPGAPGAPSSNVSPTGVLMAEVPLFGATPLSTTEPVPSGLPDPAALGSAQPVDPLLAGMPAGANGGDPSADPAMDDPSEDGESAGGGGEQMGSKEYGQGKVRNPVVLRIKMDGPVEALNGASGAMGFTISLPGRRSLSTSSSELARKDKRIASLQVVNNAHGAEVTVQFKDGIPAYRAKAKGDKLEIALGTERKAVASKAAGEKKKAPAAKKKADAKKKAPAKKDAAKKDAKKSSSSKKKASAN